jgi:hypothetical protein
MMFCAQYAGKEGMGEVRSGGWRLAVLLCRRVSILVSFCRFQLNEESICLCNIVYIYPLCWSGYQDFRKNWPMRFGILL